MADVDLHEEDVWGVVRERSEDSGPKMRKASKASSSTSKVTNVPRANSSRGSHEAEVAQQSSAPVNIPDWPKIYRKNSKKGSRVDINGDGENGGRDDQEQEDYDDDDGDEGDMVPPHEYISRRLARSQISSFSMCEGIGRTLKGRDLSKVRNAILTKTGFIE